MDTDDATGRLAQLGAEEPRLRLLVLHGSRAVDTAHERSDWDIGYLADDDLEPLELHAAVTRALGTDAVDLVDLRRASALLRFRAGRDGRLVHERTPGDHLGFVVEATRFWCDAGPVVRRAQDAVLAELTR